MIDCISVENMRESDSYTIANFVPSHELMYRAARGVYLAHSWSGPVAIVVGSGNNGGDGFALACILNEKGIHCTVFSLSNRLSVDSTHYAALAQQAGIPIIPFTSGCLTGFNEVVDCLLGTGFQGSVREAYRVAIDEINRCGAFVISVDINSGMNGDSGFGEIVVRSDLTVTIGFVKQGLIKEWAGNYMKRLICADIGITLIRKENYICSDEEFAVNQGKQGFALCPEWLDMKSIQAFS